MVTAAVLKQPEAPASVAVMVALPADDWAVTVVDGPDEGLTDAAEELLDDQETVPFAPEEAMAPVWPLDAKFRLVGDIESEHDATPHVPSSLTLTVTMFVLHLTAPVESRNSRLLVHVPRYEQLKE
jgi:hypothetical protein